MKKFVLASLIALGSFGYAIAEDKKGVVTESPDWDTRVAGEPMDVSGK